MNKNVKNMLSLLMSLVCIAAVFVFILLFQSDALPENTMIGISCLLFLILGLSFVLPYIRRKKREKEMRLRQAEQIPEEQKDSKILYLRPFHVDNTGIPATDYGGKTYYTVESILCAFMAKYGVPIAIGKPQERLQPLGAVRRYASNETWQDVVTGYLEEAKYVILYVDFTPGVLWEINKVLKHYREKLILVPRLHNIHSGRTIWLFLLSYFVFLYPLFRLFRRSLFFKRMRRGKTYYQEWDRVMQDVMPPGTINDSIAAVHFIDGNPVPYTAKDATLEAQLTAIVQAVVDKMKGNE